MQIERIAHQRVERVGGYRDHLASADGGCRALDGAFGRSLAVNLD
jgi:hypothetical protein